MTQPDPSPHPTIDRLPYTTGLRAWLRDLSDMPQSASRLLEAAERLDIMPLVIFFEYHADSDYRCMILLGEH